MRLLTVLIILAYNVPVSAGTLDRTEINNALRNLQPVETSFNNKKGVWFSKEDSELLLFTIEDTLPKALDIVDDQTKQIEILNKSIGLYKESIERYVEVANYNGQMLDVTLENLKNFQQPQYVWYEGRVALYFYGMLTATAILITSAYILDKIQQ